MNIPVLQSSTARVVWSFNRNDPTDPSGSDAVRHDYKGSRSLNLIGGMHPSGSIPLPGTHSLDITVTNVRSNHRVPTSWGGEHSEHRRGVSRGPCLPSWEGTIDIPMHLTFLSVAVESVFLPHRSPFHQTLLPIGVPLSNSLRS